MREAFNRTGVACAGDFGANIAVLLRVLMLLAPLRAKAWL